MAFNISSGYFLSPSAGLEHQIILYFQVVLSALISVALAAPQTGPLTPLVGNLVGTPRGFAPIDLEGFSEDLDQVSMS
jgi:hypothetical protein